MPSVILAGTTTGTALSLTSDTSGELQIQTNNGATTAMTLTTGGNVGIGTSSPSVKLQVQAAAVPEIRTTDGTNIFQVYSDTTNGGVVMGVVNSAPLVFRTNATERMRIDSAGNVGIGTISPDTTGGGPNLTVQAGGQQARVVLRNTASGTASGDGFHLVMDNSAFALVDQRENQPLLFNTNAIERMRIDSSGNVGVNTIPKQWVSYQKGIDLGYSSTENWGSVTARGDYTSISNNAYLNTSANWAYKNTGYLAEEYNQSGGAHTFQRAVSGTAGATISWLTSMSIDASGRVTTPFQPAFSVSLMDTTIFNANTGAASYLNGGTPNTNVGSCYNTTTGRFTAPIAGRYLITAAILVNATSGRLEADVFVNGSNANFSMNGTGSTFDGPCVTCILTLSANDYVTISRNSGVAYNAHPNTYFNGYLLG